MIEISAMPLPTFADWQALPVEVTDLLSEIYGPCGAWEFDDRGDMWLTLAAYRGEIIGAHLHVVRSKTLYARATSVDSRFEGRGVATALWCFSLDLHEVTRVKVHTCTEGGLRLVQRLRRKYKGKVQFSITNTWEHVPIITDLSTV